MMGHRAKLSGDERDAFSKMSRKILSWRSGEISRIKKLHSRKARHAAKRMEPKE